MNYFVGIDLGGTKIAGAIVNAHSHEILASTNVPTLAHEGPNSVIHRIGDVVMDLCGQAELSKVDIFGLGLGVPANFDTIKGIITFIPNLPGNWNDIPIVNILKDRLGYPIFLINDARAFTLAEATIGAGQGKGSVIGITLGTGIGGGIAINGKLFLGIDGAAGEFGHHSIDMYGIPDGGGNPGAWEGLASGPSIAAMGVRIVMQGITSKIGPISNFDLHKITPETIVKAAQQNDKVAIEILQKTGFYLGTGIANLITILAPECIVLGGGIAGLIENQWVKESMWTTILQRVHTIPHNLIDIRPAKLGSLAGVIGSAIWASQQAEGK